MDIKERYRTDNIIYHYKLSEIIPKKYAWCCAFEIICQLRVFIEQEIDNNL